MLLGLFVLLSLRVLQCDGVLICHHILLLVYLLLNLGLATRILLSHRVKDFVAHYGPRVDGYGWPGERGCGVIAMRKGRAVGI